MHDINNNNNDIGKITNKTTNNLLNQQALHYMECEVTAEGDEGGVTTTQLPFYKPHVP